jgi:hypothetical protein
MMFKQAVKWCKKHRGDFLYGKCPNGKHVSMVVDWDSKDLLCNWGWKTYHKPRRSFFRGYDLKSLPGYLHELTWEQVL